MRTRAEIGAALRQLRLAADVKQAAIAAALGVRDTTISEIELGHSGAPIERLVAIAELCGAALGVYLVPHARAALWRTLSDAMVTWDDALMRDAARFLSALSRMGPNERSTLLYLLERDTAGSAAPGSPAPLAPSAPLAMPSSSTADSASSAGPRAKRKS